MILRRILITELAVIEPLVLVDHNTLPEAGKAHVRFVHASPDAPRVWTSLCRAGRCSSATCR